MQHRILFITPWFGPLSPWHHRWAAQLPALCDMGYDFLVVRDLEDFSRRARVVSGIEPVGLYGTRKMCDWRPLFGLMYAEETRDYDFWGFTDQDCVYGRVNRWVTDEFLSGLDVHSNHDSYVCGPWTLFRTGVTEELFRQVPKWEVNLKISELTGWAETTFSRALEQSGLRYRYTMWQASNLNDMSALRRRPADGALIEAKNCLETEIMMAHFRRTKTWPSGV